MKKIILLPLVLLLFGCSGFVNECGVSTSYYNDCVEYYDSMGIYHKTCPKNNLYDGCQGDNGGSVIEECLGCN